MARYINVTINEINNCKQWIFNINRHNVLTLGLDIKNGDNFVVYVYEDGYINDEIPLIYNNIKNEGDDEYILSYYPYNKCGKYYMNILRGYNNDITSGSNMYIYGDNKITMNDIKNGEEFIINDYAWIYLINRYIAICKNIKKDSIHNGYTIEYEITKKCAICMNDANNISISKRQNENLNTNTKKKIKCTVY